jgi:4-hydroxy-tetrahydrodipicolinate synthase
MNNTIFTGAGVAIVTPFTPEGNIDYDGLGQLIEEQIGGGTDAIIICCTTGESATMTDEEHRLAIKYAVEKTAKRIPVIAGTGSNDTKYAIELSQYAESVGADGLLLVTPYYNKSSQRGLIAHFTAIAESVNIPIILYNIPSRTGVSLEVSTIAKLAEHKNIVAVKEASGSMSYAAKLIAACGDKIDVYSGNDDMIVPLMSIGAKGVISVLSNVDPKAAHEIAQAALDGDYEKAGKMQIDYLDLINALFIEVNPIPVKEALNLMNKPSGGCRMPLFPMEEKNILVLKAALENRGLM